MRRVIFVGVHNKPGKLPLDSSTRTGKIIDEIIAATPGFEHVKTNLYDKDCIEVFTGPEDKRHEWPYRVIHKWFTRIGWISGDIVVLLGGDVADIFKKAGSSGVRIIEVTHPASGKLWDESRRKRYIEMVSIIIKNQMAIDKIVASSTFQKP